MSENRLDELEKCRGEITELKTEMLAANGACDIVEEDLKKCEAEVERLRKMQPIANVTLTGDAEYFKTRAEKAEAEVKRLRALLAYNTVPY